MPLVSTNTSNNETTVSCPLCCEDKPSSAFCVLSNCQHESCQDCCIKWIEKSEVSGQETLPGCAFCRAPLTPTETAAILGRPYQPKRIQTTTTTTTNNVHEPLDDLTEQWLRTHCKPCPGCGATIEKIQGGCDMMECLCGYRFCYGCGSQGALCGCTPSHHFFWDNVMDCAARRAAPPRAPHDVLTGCVDLRNHIQRRKQKEQGEKIRKWRLSRQKILEREWTHLEETIAAAKWLFCATAENGFRILNQILERDEIRCVRAMKRHEQQRETRMQEDCILGARWLFCPTRSGLLMLKALTSCKVEMIRRKRARKKLVVQRELSLMNETTLNANWLFCSTKQGERILKEQWSRRAQKIRLSRADAKKKDSKREVPGASVAIENGSWLYQARKPFKTVRQLDGLFVFQSPLDHCRTLRTRMDGLSNRGWLLNENAEEEEAVANAIQIRLLYLMGEELKRERAQIALQGL